MAIRNYSSVAAETALNGGISNVDTVLVVASTVGFPSPPFTIAVDYGGVTEELMDVTNAAGASYTVTRGVDGTAAASHGAGAKVRHVSSARDFREANEHVNSTTNVHGLAGGAAVVGTTSTQTLTNKTLTSPTITGGTISNSSHAGGSITGTVAGSPTYSGNPVFSGTPQLNNVSGNPVFTGSPIVNGTLTASGPLVVSGIINDSQSAIKTADTTRTVATLTNDPHLSISIPNANAMYSLEAYLIVSGDPDNDINLTFSDIFGASGGWTPINFSASGATGNSGPVEIVESALASARSFGLHPSGTTRYGIHIKGFVRTLGTAGTINLQWGTLVAGGDGATINMGSWLKAERLA